MGKAGSMLKPARKTLIHISLVTKGPPNTCRLVKAVGPSSRTSTRKSTPAMARLMAGPASATSSSSLGFSGIRSRRATPPMGSRVISRGTNPEPPAVSAWLSSWRTTHVKTLRMRRSPLDAARSPCPRTRGLNATQARRRANVA
jgi:hypothetical protein